MKLLLLLLSIINYSFAAEQIVLTKENHLVFRGAFKDTYVAEKQIEFLTKINVLDKDRPFYIVLDTPGGSVFAGNLFIDTITAVGRDVRTITLQAASMGYITVQSLGKRYITPTGILMSHRASIGGISGNLPGEANTRLNFLGELTEDLSKRCAKRVGLSDKQYENLIEREFWTTGENAVKLNHADEIANVVCDPTLLQTKKIQFFSIFGSATLEMSNCPIIRSPVSVEMDDMSNKAGVIQEYLKGLTIISM